MTAAKPLVSVIIPTRNRAQCLPRALDSVYAQEGLGEDFEIEVIVVDDASSDATPGVISGYPRVRYIRHSERRGAAAAYNTGLRASTGGYISFLDDDDEWLPHKMRAQLPLLVARPEVGVIYSQTLIRRGGTQYLYPEPAKAPSGRVFLAMLVNSFCSHHASLLARREAFETAGEFDESFASYEDYDMSLRLAFHCQFLFAPGAVDVYNVSPDGLWLSRAADGAGADDAVRVIEKALRMLPDCAEYAPLKREARARVALHTALRIADPGRAWANVARFLRAHPEITEDDRSRGEIVEVGCRRALGAAPSIRGARDVSAEIEAAIAGGGVTARRGGRRMMGEFWAEVARSLAFREQANARGALYAAFCAVRRAPSYQSARLMAQIILRGVAGPRAYAFCKRVYARLRREASSGTIA